MTRGEDREVPSQRRLWDVGIDARARTSGSTDSLTRNERLSLSLLEERMSIRISLYSDWPRSLYEDDSEWYVPRLGSGCTPASACEGVGSPCGRASGRPGGSFLGMGSEGGHRSASPSAGRECEAQGVACTKRGFFLCGGGWRVAAVARRLLAAFTASSSAVQSSMRLTLRSLGDT